MPIVEITLIFHEGGFWIARVTFSDAQGYDFETAAWPSSSDALRCARDKIYNILEELQV